MRSCLPKNIADKFIDKLKSGEITPEKLEAMGDEGRHQYFASFMGEANASMVNALFESKLLLKNQQKGMITWAKQIAGLKPAVRRDLLSRIQKMGEILKPEELEDFYSDLASQRLGTEVTMEQAGKIYDMSQRVKEKLDAIPQDSPIGSPERIDYGTSLVLFKQYVSELKSNNEITNPAELFEAVASITKANAASYDNSFFLRQGFLTLINEPDIWTKNFLKSWGDIAKELKGVDANLPIKADVFSRPNAINGKYNDIGLDIGIESEEHIPSHAPGNIPLLGRLFKASEAAYNGAALRIRADLADRWIAEAEGLGVDIKSKEAGVGEAINSITGRGKVNLTPSQSKVINAAIFSIRYLKSNIDTLSAPFKGALDVVTGYKGPNAYARKKAAQYAVKTIGAIAGILTIAKFLDPESVEEDPRSSDFGKIMVGKNHEVKINVSLGMGSLITLASRLVPTTHNGKRGFWRKNAKGKYVQTNLGKYGVSDPSEIALDFMKGKAAPIAKALLNMWEGKDYSGNKVTALGELIRLATPIPIQNLYEISKTSIGEDPLLFAILEGLDLLGTGSSTKQKKKEKF